MKRTSECQGDWLPATPTSEDVMAGEVSFLGLSPVKVGKDVNWRSDPYKNRSWSMVFHSLRWMGRLVADYETNGNEAYLRRAREIAKDWVRDNPRGGRTTSPFAWQEHPIALRAPALVCLSKHVKEDWLTKSLAEHARMLADPRLYEKGHNHGIDQDIALLGIGCRYGRSEWSNLAVKRLIETVELDVDAQGALREQAPRYATYVHQRLKVAIDDIKACDRKVPSRISTRWQSLESFIAHATQPNGYMVPIGDGGADVRPVGYDDPSQKVKVFGGAGYVFGRSAWDKKEASYYSIRFGPGMKYHGHEDHLGVTYYAQGRDVLVDVGFDSYENTPYRRWTMSPEAHNVPVVAGAPFRGRMPSKLVKSTTGGDRQSYRLTDKAYGVGRTRSVLVNHGEDLMAVLDRADGKGKISNIWHFAAGLTAAQPKNGRVVLREKGFKATLVQLALPSCRPVNGLRVVKGATSPIQGWVSPSYLKKTPAPAVLSPASADPLLTIVVPGTADPEVSCSGGKVKVETADGPVTFTATPAGALS
ncbi:heparinase II/III family protein [Spongiactinospora sp. TRM90649]|uniref:heparinase II/III family protein n=1 Tax=Spongiactinospora sp. TRM90649 TaxID=3031114 RepID=UPI0023F790E7|nr:heparinase II/III family protein [Spongiactinospora sp. TRM90649]